MTKKNATKKVEDYSSNELLSVFKTMIPDVVAKAEGNGINVIETVHHIAKTHPKKSLSVGASFFTAAINNEIKNRDSSDLVGIIAGCKDTYGSERPISFLVVRSDGNHAETSSFDSKLEHRGIRESIPIPSKATLRVREDVRESNGRTFKSLKITNVDKYEALSPRDFAKKLWSIARVPADIKESDKYKVVVVKGIVHSVSPVSRIAQDKSGKWGKVGEWSLMEENAAEPAIYHPVVQLNLIDSQPSQTGVKVPTRGKLVFHRNRNVVPTVLIDDLIELCSEAAENYSTPISQAEYVSAGFSSRPVIAVGVVTNVSTSNSPQYGVTNYVDIACACIVDAPIEDVLASGQQSEQETPAKPPAEAQPPAPSEDTAANQQASITGDAATAKQKKPLKVDAIAEIIAEYCESLGIETSDLSVDEVRGKILANTDYKDKSDAILEEAKKRAPKFM